MGNKHNVTEEERQIKIKQLFDMIAKLEQENIIGMMGVIMSKTDKPAPDGEAPIGPHEVMADVRVYIAGDADQTSYMVQALQEALSEVMANGDNASDISPNRSLN